MVSAPAIETIEDAAEAAREGAPVCFRLSAPVSDEQLAQWAGRFELWFEDGEEGEIIITGPPGGLASDHTSEIIIDMGLWARITGGRARDSQRGFDPPLGRRWVPDASWVSEETLAKLTESEKRRPFWPVAPDFVLEVVSPSQLLSKQREKMRGWIAAEVRLGMLIAPDDELVELYRADGSVETFHRPDAISCDPVMPGFTMTFERIWR